ncbi:unnamed protein product, partial [Polarella glacialis]
MRIFIHNVESYLGKALVKELRRAEGGLNRIFGTASVVADAPSTVKRLSSRDDPKKAKKMAETLQSCRMVILDLFSCTVEDLHFAISALKVDPKSSPPKVTGELEGEVIFVLVSSAMVWASTKANSADGFLRDSDYKDRRPTPGSKFEQWKELEDLVLTCFNREGSQVKAFIAAGGAFYGEGEATFAEMFKDAWRGEQTHAIISPGTNRVPTVHVRDMARLVKEIGLKSDSISPLEACPYFLAVDQPPAAEGEARRPPTQAQIVQGIVDEVGQHYEVPTVPMGGNDDTMEEEARDLRDRMVLDLCLEPSAIMLDESFAASGDAPGWLCRDGFVANLRTIANEFCTGKKLRAMRVLIAGPPSSSKSELASAISDHFKIPCLKLNAQDLEDMAGQLSSNVCRYRGYVLDAGTVGFAEVEKLFRFDVEAPKSEDAEDPPPPAEGEEVEPVPPKMERRLNEELCPSFIIVSQAPPGICKAKYQ